MKIAPKNLTRTHAASAFTIAETVVAVAVLAIMLASFFAGLSMSLSVVQAARENVRATQLMSERMETLRVTRWEDLGPTNFLAFFNPATNVTGSGAAGLIYTVQVSLANAP